MTRLWKDRAGPWGEAQKILHVEASAVLDLLKAEVATTASSSRIIESRKIALSHAQEAMGYLLLGDVPQAANHLVWADAWRSLAFVTEEDHDRMTDEAARGLDATPLVREIRKSAALVLGEPCDVVGCRAPGHELEVPGERHDSLAAAAAELGLTVAPRIRRCLGPRNGLHRVLALVPRPPASRGTGPVRRGTALAWRP